MPSAFNSLFADARTLLQQQHGSAVVWTKADGTAVSVPAAIVGAEASEPRDTESGIVLYRVRTIELPTDLVLRPDRGDACTIADAAGNPVEWAYDRTLGISGGLAHVQLCRPEQAEITHRGYRG